MAAPTLRSRLAGLRERVRALPGGALAWRMIVTVIGLAVIVVGIVLLPLPGPGWLIIFAGLGVLASEYAWAMRLLHRTRGTVRGWTKWSMRQNIAVRFAVGLGGVIVIAGAAAGSWLVYDLV